MAIRRTVAGHAAAAGTFRIGLDVKLCAELKAADNALPFGGYQDVTIKKRTSRRPFAMS